MSSRIGFALAMVVTLPATAAKSTAKASSERIALFTQTPWFGDKERRRKGRAAAGAGGGRRPRAHHSRLFLVGEVRRGLPSWVCSETVRFASSGSERRHGLRPPAPRAFRRSVASGARTRGAHARRGGLPAGQPRAPA